MYHRSTLECVGQRFVKKRFSTPRQFDAVSSIIVKAGRLGNSLITFLPVSSVAGQYDIIKITIDQAFDQIFNKWPSIGFHNSLLSTAGD